MAVRPFCNADLPDLVRLWNEHWSAIGPDPMISMARFEQAVLARTFFDSESLFVFDSGKIDGCCLNYQSAGQPNRLHIGAICIGPDAPPSVISDLLGAVHGRAAKLHVDEIQAGIVRDGSFGLAGLDPIGHGIGIPSHDFRIAPVLAAEGFIEAFHVQRMTASVAGYRPPIDRDAMQLRRSTSIQMAALDHLDERAATAMSHLDVAVHPLVDSSGAELATACLWFSDPEAEVMNPAMAILDFGSNRSPEQLSAPQRYLIGSVVQSLAARGVSVVETAVDSDQQILLDQLSNLQFKGTDTGACWVRQV